MYLIILVLSLLFQNDIPPTTSVEECILRDGESTMIYEQYGRDVVDLRGTSVDLLGEDYRTILGSAKPVAGSQVLTDTGYRRVQWWLYNDQLYIGVFRHKDAPGAYVENPHGPDEWHLKCLLTNIPINGDQS